jgi:hypothetical protein
MFSNNHKRFYWSHANHPAASQILAVTGKSRIFSSAARLSVSRAPLK